MLAVILLLAQWTGPVDRAVAYLSREVASWRGENGCFSCHNNGDAARALLAAGVSPEAPALRETIEWLRHPKLWDSNPGNPAVSDKTLARLQFANALLAAGGSKEALCHAASAVAKDRGPVGAWTVDGGSPATYGTTLATATGYRILSACGLETGPTARWLADQAPQSTLDRAALLLHNPDNSAGADQLAKLQNPDGGWGEFAGLPSQVFDTSIAVLALRGRRADEVLRARKWLVARQLAEGGWPETTRPPGSQSYAQHISTSAWALLALLPDPDR